MYVNYLKATFAAILILAPLYVYADPRIDALAEAIESGDHDAIHRATLTLERTAYQLSADTADSKALADDLVTALNGSGSNLLSRECLYVLSIVGTPEHIPAIAAKLLNPDLADDARMALQRIPGAPSTNALIGALSYTRGDLRLRIIEALAARGDVEAITPLRNLTQERDADLQWSLLDALGDLGVPPAQITELKATFTPRENVIYVNAFLAAAFARLDQGAPEIAARMFTSAAGYYYYPYQAGAALTGMEASRAPAFFRQAMGFMDQPGIRPVVIRLLTETEFDGADDLLLRAYDVVGISQKTTLLEILAARNSPGLVELIEKVNAPNAPAELRYVARNISGQGQTAEDLEAVAVEGTYWRRGEAAHALYAMAEALRAEEESDLARGLFERIAAQPMNSSVRISALGALEEMAHSDSLPVLRGLKDALFEAKHLQESIPQSPSATVNLDIREIGAEEASRATVRRPYDGAPTADASVANVVNDEAFALALDRAYVAVLASLGDRGAIGALGASTESAALKEFIEATLERMKTE